MANHSVQVVGGGPAGCSAALAALSQGVPVHIAERPGVIAHPFRHKVCGEFFSPEMEPALQALGVWKDFLACGPARVRRMELHFGRQSKKSLLPQPAWGLSRSRFDALLLQACRDQGALVAAGPVSGADPRGPAGATVLATGRGTAPGSASRDPRGCRLFGFKAHFSGPADDAVALFFFDRCYVGVSSIENGLTNVCGLGPEDVLGRYGFHYDSVLDQCPALADRLEPLTRTMDWLSTGPLQFGPQPVSPQPAMCYLAGDRFSFADPFTGSGILAAIRSGTMAGWAAAQGESPLVYHQALRGKLERPFLVASALRALLRHGWADRLAPLIPGPLLFSLTRPG